MKTFGIFLIVLLSVVVLGFLLIFVTPSFFGIHAEPVTSAEATGKYLPGDLVYIAKTDARNILLGETAVKQTEEGRRFFTITAKNKESAEGTDANGQTILLEGEIEKVALRIPGLGYGLMPFRSFWGVTFVVLGAAAWLAGGILLFRLGARRAKRRRASRRGVYTKAS